MENLTPFIVLTFAFLILPQGVKPDSQSAPECNAFGPMRIRCGASYTYGSKNRIIITWAGYKNSRNGNGRDVTDIIRGKCQCNKQCDVYAINEEYGDPLPGTGKQLYVDYYCSDGKPICFGQQT